MRKIVLGRACSLDAKSLMGDLILCPAINVSVKWSLPQQLYD
jgi:hypothetical protein